MSGFSDHFSANAPGYARFRPEYPARLFEELAARVPADAVVWDCATGTGQAAVALAGHFGRVIATDASAEQIGQARAHPNVEYRVAKAEDSGLPAESVDLVTVAQAVHWFDLGAFYQEVGRVLRPGGLIALWCYGPPQFDQPDLQRHLDHYYNEVVGPYWPPERHLVEEGYRSLLFPFDEMSAPALTLSVKFDLNQMIGYLGTWSATLRYRKALDRDPLVPLRERLLPDWGNPDATWTLHWPLPMRLGRLRADPASG